jgi:hypothetical protein
MSGDDIPYQLRPNKFIDRQMFLELLSRLIGGRGPENYVYISMGGRHLVDHRAVYGKLGIRALFSFDMDANQVARQKFNRPTGDMVCVEMLSANLPSELDTIFQRFPRRRNVIAWLDYTSAHRRAQFQEAVETLVRLKHGDIFRITLNADIRSLSKGNEWKDKGFANPGGYRVERLRAQISEYLATDVTSISDTNFPKVLAASLGLAIDAAHAQQPNLKFTPVLMTSYKDGTRMLTITCAVSEADNDDKFPNDHFRRWKFACRGWNDLQMIYAPMLSLKEQYRLDVNLHRGAKRMLSALKFLPAVDEAASLQAIESYRLFHRYYPTFRHVED